MKTDSKSLLLDKLRQEFIMFPRPPRSPFAFKKPNEYLKQHIEKCENTIWDIDGPLLGPPVDHDNPISRIGYIDFMARVMFDLVFSKEDLLAFDAEIIEYYERVRAMPDFKLKD